MEKAKRARKRVNVAPVTDWSDLVEEFFGPGVPWTQKGKFCVVQMPTWRFRKQQQRWADFDPMELFDPDCPHCKPFLEEGGMIVIEKKDVHAFRFNEGGFVEMATFPRRLQQRRPQS